MATDPVQLVAGPGDAGRLDMFLAGSGVGLSRAAAQKLIRAGAVRINGDVASHPAASVAAGDRVEVAGGSTASGRTEGAGDHSERTPVTIAYEDEWILIVDKAAGVVVHPGAGSHGNTLVDALLELRPEIAGVGPDPDRPGILHRLDKDTSGLLAVAKTAEAHERLAAAVKRIGQLIGPLHAHGFHAAGVSLAPGRFAADLACHGAVGQAFGCAQSASW